MNNKKKLLIAGMLFSIACVGQAMNKKTITLSSSSTLKKRLTDASFDHFLEKTKIDEKLGGKKLYVEGVVMTVELALYDYAKDLGNPMVSMMMQMRKPELFKIILQDLPKALEELKKFNDEVESLSILSEK